MASNGKQVNRGMIGLGVGLIVLGLIFLSSWLEENNYDHRLAGAGAAGAVVDGVVIRSSPGFKSRDDAEPPEVEYRYTVKGIEYNSYQSRVYLEVGQSVKVEYDPSDPQLSRIAGESVADSGMSAMGLLVIGLGVAALVAGIRGRSDTRKRDITD